MSLLTNGISNSDFMHFKFKKKCKQRFDVLFPFTYTCANITSRYTLNRELIEETGIWTQVVGIYS